MKVERLSKKEAAEAMTAWIDSSFALPALGKDYQEMRGDLTTLFQESRTPALDEVRSYEMDVYFGTALYAYLSRKPWFTERLAADDGFWRYLALKVVPNLVGSRWGNDNEEHYYTKPNRNWLKAIWWYVHLSMKRGGLERTKSMLLSGGFSTDTILNLVERSGRHGTNVAVYRAIMSKFASLDKPTMEGFRRVMKLNTAKSVVIEPVFFTGGIEGYVSSLFEDVDLS